MSQEAKNGKVQEQTRLLLDGPLKHIRAATLAAALVPLASVVATPAAAQTSCGNSGGICGLVFTDTNGNGIQDAGDQPIIGAVVSANFVLNGEPYVVATDVNGFFYLSQLGPGAPWEITVQTPPGSQPSPANVGGDKAIDNDGVSDGMGNSVTTVVYEGFESTTTDFGFVPSAVVPPGTGTPGYWKNHPEAWPVNTIMIGNTSYTTSAAIVIMQKPDNKDKTLTMFSSLLSAKLNVIIGNEDECIASTIAAADVWMATYTSPVHAASLAWKLGEPLHRRMDNYNNGMLCAPHRD